MEIIDIESSMAVILRAGDYRKKLGLLVFELCFERGEPNKATEAVLSRLLGLNELALKAQQRMRPSVFSAGKWNDDHFLRSMVECAERAGCLDGFKRAVQGVDDIPERRVERLHYGLMGLSGSGQSTVQKLARIADASVMPLTCEEFQSGIRQVSAALAGQDATLVVLYNMLLDGRIHYLGSEAPEIAVMHLVRLGRVCLAMVASWLGLLVPWIERYGADPMLDVAQAEKVLRVLQRVVDRANVRKTSGPLSHHAKGIGIKDSDES